MRVGEPDGIGMEMLGNHGVCLISRITDVMVMLVVSIRSGSLATLGMRHLLLFVHN